MEPWEALLRISATTHFSVRPVFDVHRRTLSFDGLTVKAFRHRSPNQEIVLMTFQELDWPFRIDDPLLPSPDVDARERLANTVRRLNHCHLQPVLGFRMDGTGSGVLWIRT